MVTKTTYHQIFTDLEQSASRRSATAETLADLAEINYDAMWYGIRAIAYALDGATPAKVRALLLDRGYNV